MKKSTVTFTVEHEKDWQTHFTSGDRVEQASGLAIWVPKDAKIETTEIREPLKVGDMIDDSDVLDRTLEGTVLLDRDGDAWRARTGIWHCTAYDADHDPLKFGPLTVIHVRKGDPR